MRSFKEFDAQYEVITTRTGSVLREDPPIKSARHRVWTVTEIDGVLTVAPGYVHSCGVVIGYALTRKPWDNEEECFQYLDE